MLGSKFRFINEQFYADDLTPDLYDELLADGWRHFGRLFFRYNFAVYRNTVRLVIPLRIETARFELSKSRRRNLKKNAGLRTEITRLNINADIEELFFSHRSRFTEDLPNDIYDFLPPVAAESPCEIKQFNIFIDDKLAAVSFLGVGAISASSIYAVFDPAYSNRGLGTFTLLKEMEYALAQGSSLLYLGYAYEGNSFYDYKKKFPATQYFDWNGNWANFIDPFEFDLA